MNKASYYKEFALRRSSDPYISLSVICAVVTVVWISYMIKTNDWSPLLGIGITALFLGQFVWFGMSYRIWWRIDAVVMRAAGVEGVFMTIKAKEISLIKQEGADVPSLLSTRTPFRRIMIYGSGPAQKIDVSLKHFKTEDIRTLMRVIHERRPDLVIPGGWLGDQAS